MICIWTKFFFGNERLLKAGVQFCYSIIFEISKKHLSEQRAGFDIIGDKAHNEPLLVIDREHGITSRDTLERMLSGEPQEQDIYDAREVIDSLVEQFAKLAGPQSD